MDIQPFSSDETKTDDRPEIKLIVVDLDKTLLNEFHVVSERNREALQRAMDAGIQVILATGKTRYSAESIIAALNLDTPGIYVQGLVVFNGDGSIRYQTTLDPKIARRVITVAEDRGFMVMAYSGNRIVTQSTNHHTDDFKKYREPEIEGVGPLYNILDVLPINKLVLIGDERGAKALRWQLDKQLSGDARVLTAGIPHMFEVLPVGQSKGRALKQLLKEMNIAAENVMAIGDGENDIEMLELAGLAIAVENAHEGLKAVADEIVSDHTKDAIAEAIDAFVLPPEPEPEPDTSDDKSENDDASSDKDDKKTAEKSDKTETDA